MSNTTVILANGDFPTHPIPLQILRKARHVVCCDGAGEALLRHGRQPDAIVGDMDSLPSEIQQKFQESSIAVAEQETNDLSKAFRFCLKYHWTEGLTILGATGKREDHTLGNISLLADFSRLVPHARIVSDYGKFFALTGSGDFPTQPGQPVSLFAIEPNTAIFSRGLHWPLDGLAPSRWWQATLNRATGFRVHLDIPAEKTILIYLPFAAENTQNGDGIQ